ncbi:MAG: glycosyltransferase family 4 protein, partial [Actinomycetota bacterium]|nr:glycosyltransferase family 4 protein [Actinomycetota bacterium]
RGSARARTRPLGGRVIRLGIDATSVAPNGKGIARVQRGTVEALAALGRHELVVFARHPEELPGVPVERVTLRPALVWEQVGLSRAIQAQRLDALLTWTERLPLTGGGRFLVWLFEPPTLRIHQNRVVGAGAYQRASDLVTLALWRRSLDRAAIVFTGSDATAEALPRSAARVRTLYPGLDPRFSPGPGADEGRFVLHLGSSDPRDDTETALAAFERARPRLPEGTRLRVVGGFDGPPAEGVDYLGRVSDEELVSLYRGALAYLDASLYEGFGYQVLEAMACGTPVVATRVTSIPELADGAALLCEARDVHALADALVSVATDPVLAGRLRGEGLARSGTFTWERTATELAAAVEEVVG